MTKRLTKTTILFFSTVCFLFRDQPALGQDAAANVLTNLQTQARRVPTEELYLHTDKDVYLAGEISWFRLYYAINNRPADETLSQLAYVELLDTSGKAILQGKISLKKEERAGSFFLPLTLPTGSYMLRAYTNWMKNSDEGYFFHKQVTIINPLRRTNANAAETATGVRVDFLPEGGKQVTGLPVTMGFRVADESGKGLTATGVLLNQAGDTVTRFQTLKFGMGRFFFRPQPGQVYMAVISTDGRAPVRQTIPLAQENGFVLQVTNEGDRLRIMIGRKESNASGKETVLIAAHSRQVLLATDTRSLDRLDSAVVYINKSVLSEGINHFTLFNQMGKPVCERLFFNKPAGQTIVRLMKPEKPYGTREKVKLGFEWTGSTTNDEAPDMSVSIHLLDSVSLLTGGDCASCDYYFSGLPARVESPAYYFSSDADAAGAADNLMLVYGWRTFKWMDLDRDGQPILRFPPEYNGQLIRAKITSARTGEPAPQVTAMLSVSGQHPHFTLATSDDWGICHFEVKEYYGNEKLICQLRDGDDSLYRVEMLSPFLAPVSMRSPHPMVWLNEELRSALEERAIGMQTRNIYRGDSLNLFNPPVLIDTFPFYGKPDVRYNLDEYKRFTSMEEVLREYVLEIGVGIRGKGLTYKMLNPEIRSYFEGKGLVLIDGVPISNPDRIFDYDPLKVKTLDVIPKLYVIGNSAFQGIASFTTYNGSFDAFELDPRLVAIDYEGLQLQREFYIPDYGSSDQLNSRLPDFRHTLYWNPHVRINPGVKDVHLEFYTSDQTGSYLVIMQGVDANGKFFYDTEVLEVK